MRPPGRHNGDGSSCAVLLLLLALAGLALTTLAFAAGLLLRFLL